MSWYSLWFAITLSYSCCWRTARWEAFVTHCAEVSQFLLSILSRQIDLKALMNHNDVFCHAPANASSSPPSVINFPASLTFTFSICIVTTCERFGCCVMRCKNTTSWKTFFGAHNGEEKLPNQRQSNEFDLLSRGPCDWCLSSNRRSWTLWSPLTITRVPGSHCSIAKRALIESEIYLLCIQLRAKVKPSNPSSTRP